MHTASWRAFGVALLAAAGACSNGYRDEEYAGENGPPAEVTTPWDQSFIDNAARAGRKEIDLAQLAIDRAADPEVRALAERMERDHRAAGQELERIATGEGFDVPQDLPRDHGARVEELSGLSGSDFDRRYVSLMVTEHRTVIAHFEDAARRADNVEIREYAQRTLPTLREHLEHARACNERLNKP